MMRALYKPVQVWTIFGFGPTTEVEVEFLAWEGQMARVLMPVAEDSVIGLVCKNAGKPMPPPIERLVPRASITLFED